jgi:hypothetical protein
MFSLSLLFTVVHVLFFDVLSTTVNGLCDMFKNISQRPLTVVLRTSNDGIESLEQITEAINSGTENIKEQYMNNRDKENIAGNIFFQ